MNLNEKLSKDLQFRIDERLKTFPWVIGDARASHEGVKYKTFAVAAVLTDLSEETFQTYSDALYRTFDSLIKNSWRLANGLPVIFRLKPLVAVEHVEDQIESTEELQVKKEGEPWLTLMPAHDRIKIRVRMILGNDKEDFVDYEVKRKELLDQFESTRREFK